MGNPECAVALSGCNSSSFAGNVVTPVHLSALLTYLSPYNYCKYSKLVTLYAASSFTLVGSGLVPSSLTLVPPKIAGYPETFLCVYFSCF